MRVLVLLAVLTATAPSTLQAQWSIKTPTTADLRGIDNVGKGIAWASGTNGTVLRTEDAGYLWQACTIPPNAEHLDFRGIQAFDANTAIVMSSGPGDQSRLYKTTDGCQTWTLLFTNPDKEGFFDSLLYVPDDDATLILGDPVNGQFRLFSQSGEGAPFSFNWNGHPITAQHGEAAFAASNSNLIYNFGEGMFSFITGGSISEIIHEEHGIDAKKGMFSEWSRSPLPFPHGEGSGAFSIAARPTVKSEGDKKHGVVVGGDYTQPTKSQGTGAYSDDWGYHWHPSTTPPHGYRSAVAYDAATKTWITVGPNGTDISTDDGRNWRPLHPTNNEAPDADQHWNALSLPYAVGPHGRIGILNPSALQPAPTKP